MSKRLLVYVFAAVIGLFGGRIITAALIYAELGWTATWAEIGTWGPIYRSDPVTVKHGSGRVYAGTRLMEESHL